MGHQLLLLLSRLRRDLRHVHAAPIQHETRTPPLMRLAFGLALFALGACTMVVQQSETPPDVPAPTPARGPIPQWTPATQRPARRLHRCALMRIGLRTSMTGAA